MADVFYFKASPITTYFKSRTSPTALPAAQGDAALGTQLTDPLIAQSCFPWRFGRGAICKSILVRSVGESGHSVIRKSIPGNQIAKAKPPTYPNLKIKFPSIGSVGIQLVEPQYKLSFEVDDNLEVLCHNSGMKGCWFRCKVLQVSQKCLKVQYDDIQDCDGPEKLEEWIPSYRVAGSYKLGMRCTGRVTVHPRPLEHSSDFSFELGAAVDAWWSDGWGEGVVAGFDVCGSGIFRFTSLVRNILLEIQRKNVRTSREWVDDKWVEVEGKKDKVVHKLEFNLCIQVQYQRAGELLKSDGSQASGT